MTPWLPDDQELDGVAKELAPPHVDPDRVEQARTSLLAGAALGPALAVRSWSRWVAGGAALAAAAAVLVVWLVASSRGPKQIITALGPASYERARDWPDFVVHLTDGRIEVQVAALSAGERLRVVTSDAEVDARATSFELRAARDRLLAVRVQVGRVELRVADQRVVVLAAGESWNANEIARADVVPIVPSPVPPPQDHPAAPSQAPPIASSAPPPSPTPHVVTHAQRASSSPAPTAPAPTSTAAVATATPPVSAPSQPPLVPAPARSPAALPGEADFRAGWAALRANDAATAADKLDAACKAALHTALGDDACFWAAAAAKRANDPARARAALDVFIASFPASPRIGEASALLGWILLDAGDRSGAERAFHRAEQDRVPKIRDSAAKGLAALRAKRP
ncbi:MAG TPA: hypothetical protein VFQ65_05095 [Kofleriaceae bacterium]|nr:hypothetical protein [Kofleriaceae bacterium]